MAVLCHCVLCKDTHQFSAACLSADDWISRFVSAVLDAEGTRRQSIQDMPNEEEYIKIDINCRGSVNILFVYKEKEIYYIEQPYQGIYQTEASFYEMLIGK